MGILQKYFFARPGMRGISNYVHVDTKLLRMLDFEGENN
jgi:hypothetical protein